MRHLQLIILVIILQVTAVACGGQTSQIKQPTLTAISPKEYAVDTKESELSSNNLVTSTPLSVNSSDSCELITDYLRDATSTKARRSVPVSPNATLLVGTIHCVRDVQASSLNIKPDMPIYLAEVEIIKAENVEDFVNRLAGQEGDTIIIFSKAEIPLNASGRSGEGVVTFRGDERGGSYWVADQLLLK